jgi:uncharacterized repeat protein (TIGR01451 family)/LPXTG-motif cell wall-anchored protein
VSPAAVRTVAYPEFLIPIDSACTLTEPGTDLPALVDSAYQWADPTFTVDGELAPSSNRTVSFVIPSKQEDTPVPTAAIGVTNAVTQTPGSFTVAKSSDPASGTTVSPGQTITYSLTVDSTGTVPVHDVVVTDDLTGVLGHASLVPGSVTAPDGTLAVVSGQSLVWTLGAIPNGATRTLTYQVTVAAGAYDITLRNVVSGVGDVTASTCAPGSADPSCSTTHQTSAAPPTPPPPTPPPTPPTPPGPPLPDTGFAALPLLLSGLLLLVAGAALVVVTRRRRPSSA